MSQLTSSGPDRLSVVAKLSKSLKFLDSKLQKQSHVAGDCATIADMAVAIELSQLTLSGIAEFEAEMALYPALQAWVARMQCCDTFKRLHAQLHNNRSKICALSQRRPNASALPQSAPVAVPSATASAEDEATVP